MSLQRTQAKTLERGTQNLQVQEPCQAQTKKDHSCQDDAQGASATSKRCSLQQQQNDKEDGTHQDSRMQRRLLETNVVDLPDVCFVPDTVSKEVLQHLQDGNDEDNKENDHVSPHHHHVSHVKTGVWEVVTFSDSGEPQDPPFYVVTGVSMDDRVDTKKLRRLLFPEKTTITHKNQRKPKIHLAPTTVAEALTGYKSGTMAPICHTTPMKVFLDETVLQFEECKGQQQQQHHIVCGSGMFGTCLSIRQDKFLEVARCNPEGLVVASLVQTRKQKKDIDTS